MKALLISAVSWLRIHEFLDTLIELRYSGGTKHRDCRSNAGQTNTDQWTASFEDHDEPSVATIRGCLSVPVHNDPHWPGLASCPNTGARCPGFASLGSRDCGDPADS